MNEHGKIIGAPELAEKHLPVFDVAVEARHLAPGHIKMMGAVQAVFEWVDLEDGEHAADRHGGRHRGGLHPGLEARRQGAGHLPRRLKTAQALRTDAQEDQGDQGEGRSRDLRERGGLHGRRGRGDRRGGRRPRRWPRPVPARAAPPAGGTTPKRKSLTHKFSLGGQRGLHHRRHVRRRDGRRDLPDRHRQGGIDPPRHDELVATAISIALQYGVPLETLVSKFAYMRFDPEGIAANPEVRRQVDARLHHAMARVALPRRRRSGGARHPHARGARPQDGRGHHDRSVRRLRPARPTAAAPTRPPRRRPPSRPPPR